MLDEQNKKSNREVYITTTDNPFDPSDDFRQWYIYDESNGYHTCSLLDRMSNTAFNALTDDENQDEIERAIDAIIQIHGDKVYKKIIKEESSS